MLLVMGFGALLVLIAPLVVYLQTGTLLADGQRQSAKDLAGVAAASVADWVETRGRMADRVVARPVVLKAAQVLSGPTVLDAAAQFFPDAIRVRLFPLRYEQVDKKAQPPIGYATLDLLRLAEKQDKPPPAELHAAGTPAQHINLVRRIDVPGGGPVGHLMVSLSVDGLRSLLGAMQTTGYLELQQTGGPVPLVFARQGDASLGTSDGEGAEVVKVPGTRWRVVAWPARVGGGQVLLMTAAGAGIGGAVVLLVLAWFGLQHSLDALRADQATVLTILKDMRDGRVKHVYNAALVECHDAIELMARAASSVQRAAAAASSAAGTISPSPAAAGGVESADAEDASPGDLLFDDDALAVAKPGPAVSDSAQIFRAYDIRGIAGETLTPELAYEIGRAIGSEAYFRGEQTLVVGRDGRLSSPELAQALIRGLVATGREVKDIGVVPTPVLYFAAQYLCNGSGVMVTGSHNPAEYNGFKIVLGGETLSGDAIQSLRARIDNGDLLTGEGSVEKVDVVPDYIERIKSDVQLVRSLTVVVDCGNGVGGVAAPQLLQALGCKVIELYCEVDGNFPNHHPDPGKTENLTSLIQAVQEHHADIGIAFDGDADRIGVVASGGEIIWPDRLLMLLARDVLSRNPGAQIIYDVKCSRHVATVVAGQGGEALMWATGHSLIKAKMRETGALLAGEMSGHIFFRERWYGFDDALYTAARLLEIIANDTRSSSELFAELPNSVNTPELNVPMREGEPAAFMEKLLNSAHFENARVATIDGLRAEFERGWGLVRASNTTPCLVLRFEADDELAMSSIQDEFKRVMLQVDPNLKLPF
ncbi:MAG TPA: phosphomannomutase/phosphoglucomutase [Gammaproteobacteria bacterium]|nr:phosphomannomutase/phosphoglucomutase [Gammaproteobacteria bacterium]